jgi:hypothetical protein
MLARLGYQTSLVGKAHFQPLASRPGLESIECQPTLRDLDCNGPVAWGKRLTAPTGRSQRNRWSDGKSPSGVQSLDLAGYGAIGAGVIGWVPADFAQLSAASNVNPFARNRATHASTAAAS